MIEFTISIIEYIGILILFIVIWLHNIHIYNKLLRIKKLLEKQKEIQKTISNNAIDFFVEMKKCELENEKLKHEIKLFKDFNSHIEHDK